MNRKYNVDEKLKIDVLECIKEGNKRILIKTKVREGLDKKAVVLGINPSTADEKESDTTLTKITKYLSQFDVGELAMINLFETISPKQEDIIKSHVCELERHEELLKCADMIIIAWGVEQKYTKEKEKGIEYLQQWSDKTYCIMKENGSMPRHPSRIAYSEKLVKFFDYYTKKYPVVTLCGSTRFKDEFMEAQKNLTLQGKIVISVGLFGHAGDCEVWEGKEEGCRTKTKAMLDDMHKRKIDMSDEIFVINKDGYIGESTQREIDYAKWKGIKVNYLED